MPDTAEYRAAARRRLEEVRADFRRRIARAGAPACWAGFQGRIAAVLAS